MLIPRHVGSYLLHPQSSEKVTLVLFSHFPSHHHFLMMDRPSSSTNPLFIEQDDDMSSFVTKSHLFGAQRALHQEQQAMNDRIDNLATDLRLSEQRTCDYFDNKLDAHKQENDARMDEIRALLVNRPPSTSSYSRRSHSSRHSDDTFSSSSTPSSTILR